MTEAKTLDVFGLWLFEEADRSRIYNVLDQYFSGLLWLTFLKTQLKIAKITYISSSISSPGRSNINYCPYRHQYSLQQARINTEK